MVKYRHTSNKRWIVYKYAKISIKIERGKKISTILKLTSLDVVYIVRTAALQIESKIAVQDFMKKKINEKWPELKTKMMNSIYLKLNFNRVKNTSSKFEIPSC